MYSFPVRTYILVGETDTLLPVYCIRWSFVLWKKLILAKDMGWVGRVTFLRKVVRDIVKLFLHFRAERKWR